jgi:hypothetical protein
MLAYQLHDSNVIYSGVNDDSWNALRSAGACPDGFSKLNSCFININNLLFKRSREICNNDLLYGTIWPRNRQCFKKLSEFLIYFYFINDYS